MSSIDSPDYIAPNVIKLLETWDIVCKTWPEHLKKAYIAASDFDPYNERDLGRLKVVLSEWLDSPRDIDAVLASFGWLPVFGQPGEHVHILSLLAPPDDVCGELLSDPNILAGFVIARYQYDWDGPIPNLLLPLPPAHAKWKEQAREIVGRLRESARATVDEFIRQSKRTS